MDRGLRRLRRHRDAAFAVVLPWVPEERVAPLLVHAGLSRPRALLLNLATGLASAAGAVAAYYGLRRALGVLPYALAFAAAGFLYIAVAGLIPGLHCRADARTSALQVIFITLGVGMIAAAEALAGR
jgi:zinc and cadmium transporter